MYLFTFHHRSDCFWLLPLPLLYTSLSPNLFLPLHTFHSLRAHLHLSSSLAFSRSHESQWQAVSPPLCPVFTLGSRAAPGWLHFRNVTPKVPALLLFLQLPSLPFSPPLLFLSFILLFPQWAHSPLLLTVLLFPFPSFPFRSSPPSNYPPLCPITPSPLTSSPSSPSATFLSFEPPPSPLTFICPLFKIQCALSRLTHCPPPPHPSPHSPAIIPSPPTSLYPSVLPPSFLCCLTQTNQGGLSSVVAAEETHHMSDWV